MLPRKVGLVDKKSARSRGVLIEKTMQLVHGYASSGMENALHLPLPRC